MQTRPKFAAREETALVKRLRFFSEVERANTFLFWKTNVRKIQNAAVIPATETVIFLDLSEA